MRKISNWSPHAFVKKCGKIQIETTQIVKKCVKNQIDIPQMSKKCGKIQIPRIL